jgi:hypothetical protein
VRCWNTSPRDFLYSLAKEAPLKWARRQTNLVSALQLCSWVSTTSPTRKFRGIADFKRGRLAFQIGASVRKGISARERLRVDLLYQK